MEEIIKRYLRKIYYNLKTCVLWLFMAVLTRSCCVRAFSSAFLFVKVNTLHDPNIHFCYIFCRLVVSLSYFYIIFVG